MERRGIEEEWRELKSGMVEGGVEVCGLQNVGCGKRKGSEWWNDNVKKGSRREEESI